MARLVCRLADGATLVGRQLRYASQDLGQLGLSPEIVHAQLLERLPRSRRSDRVLGITPQLRNPLDHDVRTLDDRWVGTAPRVTSYRATVAAMAALRECEAI